MAQITAWKCDYTGKIFEDVISYRAHLRELARKRQADSKQIKEAFNSLSNVTNILDLSDKLNEVAREYYKNYNIDIDIKFEFNIWYNDSVSNTHCCPQGGELNFCQESHLPTGYPGFNGQIKWYISKKTYDLLQSFPHLRINNFLGACLIYTGTGSTGSTGSDFPSPGWNKNVAGVYDVKLFSADFPNLVGHSH